MYRLIIYGWCSTNFFSNDDDNFFVLLPMTFERRNLAYSMGIDIASVISNKAEENGITNCHISYQTLLQSEILETLINYHEHNYDRRYLTSSDSIPF